MELPPRNRDTVSTPAEMKTSPSPALIACIAILEVCREDAQYRVMVVPGTWSNPNSTATTRPMLKPCSPPGRPQPSIRSSISATSSSGTWSSAACGYSFWWGVVDRRRGVSTVVAAQQLNSIRGRGYR